MEIVTLQEAKERGLKRYFTGKPCKNGHIAERITSNRKCSVCHREMNGRPEALAAKKRYKDRNREQILEDNRRDYAENREARVATRRQWRANNPTYAKEYQKKNLHKFREYNAKRKAAELQATPLWYYNEKDQIEAIYAEATRITQETGVAHHVDHIVPLQSDIVCGLHCYDNLQILEGTENQSKHNRLED